MPSVVMRLAVTGLFLVANCASGQAGAATTPDSGVESLYTSLKTSSCTAEIDKEDPNDARYQVCPGVAGYRLQMRQVESGRLSLNVVTPAKRMLPLNYQKVVTRSMDDVDDKAEWRVRRENGKAVPIALIVRVLAHENVRDPEKITRAYWAVAKIVAGRACVTDSIREGSKPIAEVRAIADSAGSRSCAAQLPVTAGATVR